MKWLRPMVATALLLAPATAGARCLTDGEIEAALGDQIRADAPFIDHSALPDLPLCSGLTLAQQVQRMRAALHPEEQRQRDEERAALIAQEEAAARQREAEAREDVAGREADIRAAQPEIAAAAVIVPPPVKVSRPAAKAPGKRKAAAPARRAASHASYGSCREARAAGAAPLYRGSPGYAAHLDRDNDGVACE